MRFRTCYKFDPLSIKQIVRLLNPTVCRKEEIWKISINMWLMLIDFIGNFFWTELYWKSNKWLLMIGTLMWGNYVDDILLGLCKVFSSRYHSSRPNLWLFGIGNSRPENSDKTKFIFQDGTGHGYVCVCVCTFICYFF